MLTVSELVKVVGVPLLISAIVSVANVVYASKSQEALLHQNIVAVKELAEVVTRLRVDTAADRGRYVTWEELRLELRSELHRGRTNGG